MNSDTLHEIVSFIPDQTKNGAPMLRATFKDGGSVNIFDNQHWRFYQFEEVKMDAPSYWDDTPIGVMCYINNKNYLNLAKVLPREDYHKPSERLPYPFNAKWILQAIRDDYVVFDTETTNLSATRRIIQLGAVTKDGQKYLWLINPQEEIDAEATAVHGITNEMVANEPTFAELLPKIYPIFFNKLAIAYNAPFDEHVINYELERAGAIYRVRGHCLMRHYTYGRKWVSLNDALKDNGVEWDSEHAHDALADALGTQKLLHALADMVK